MLAMQALVFRLPMLVEIGLVALSAWLLTGWLMPFDIKVNEINRSNVVRKEIYVDIELIQNTPLFGSVEKVVEAKNKPAKSVLPSRLSIKLTGTVVADEKSAAVVDMAGGKEQQLFVVGDAMQPGVVLHSIEEDAIVVDHQGKLERIGLPKENHGQSSSPATLYQSPSSHSIRPNTSPRAGHSIFGNNIRNVHELLNHVRFVPHFSKGKSDGFMVSQMVPDSLYEKVGLQNGDIIRKVNGTVIANPQQAVQMLQSLQNGTAIEMEIERTGSVQQLRYDQ